jgi:hypothetical protein
MVYCSRCGTLNPDAATTCSNCGNPLPTANPQSRPYDWREQRRQYYQERYRQYRRAGSGMGLLIGGVIILLLALGLFYGAFWQFFGPAVLVIIGVWLIALFLMRNRRYRQPPPQ